MRYPMDTRYPTQTADMVQCSFELECVGFRTYEFSSENTCVWLAVHHANIRIVFFSFSFPSIESSRGLLSLKF